ncbi:hypothetical protein EI555_008350, partial [Monodon monoceros]
GALLVQFRQPSASGLSQNTSSLYTSNGVAASNKLRLSCNQITAVINVSVEVENTLYQDTHARPPSALLPREGPGLALPDTHGGTRPQLHSSRPTTEFQLFGKNTAHTVNSPMDVIPNIYEKEVGLMAAK